MYLSFYENTDQCVQLSNRILDYLRQKSAAVGSLDFFQDSSLECFLTWAYTCPVSLVLGRWIHASSCCCGDVLFEQKPEKIVDQNSFNELEKRWPFLKYSMPLNNQKKTLLQLVPHLATSSKILQCKIIVVQTCKNEKHQLDVMICWTNMLHLSIYLPISYTCTTYIHLSMLCMHGVYPWLNKHLWS